MTIKQQTIEAIKKVLRRGRKYYARIDFPFPQQINGYPSYQGRIFKEYMRSKGYIWIKASEIDIDKIDGRKFKKNNTIVIKPGNFIQYKR